MSVNTDQTLALQKRRIILIITDMRTGVDMDIARVNIKAQTGRTCKDFEGSESEMCDMISLL